MKLTNLSLAILVALGVAACGGSDNDNQTVDHNNGNNNGGNSGSTGTTTNKPTIPPVLDPTRAAPTMSVDADVKSMVENEKALSIAPRSVDEMLGYDAAGINYNKDNGTDPANIKLTSKYNYKQENDVYDKNKTGSGFSTTDINGAINLGNIATFDATVAKNLPVFALGSDGMYYHLEANDDGTAGKEYSASTTFKATGASNTVKFSGQSYDAIPQSAVVFIANGDHDSTATTGFELGNANADGYDLALNEVVVGNLKVLEQSVNLTAGGAINLTKVMPNKNKIIEGKITSHYVALNTKNANTMKDDNIFLDRDITLGNVKLYNLPYSSALITSNADKTSKKKIFDAGNFLVKGFKTGGMPKEGRALYNGKYFDISSSGEIELYADFTQYDPSIQGKISNRKDDDGNVLSNLGLERISLKRTGATPLLPTTFENGVVTGDPSYADGWKGSFYGPNAEEVAGQLLKGADAVGVYGAQRGILGDKSLK